MTIMYPHMIIHYKRPVLILYTAVLWDPATLQSNYDTSPVTPHQCQGTDIPLPGQAERMVKHVAGCEHTAHLGFPRSCGATSAPPRSRFISYFLVKSQLSATCFENHAFLFAKGSAFLQVPFPGDSLAMSFPTSFPFNHETFEDHRRSDLPTCQ